MYSVRTYSMWLQSLFWNTRWQREREKKKQKEREREKEIQRQMLISRIFSYCFSGSPLWMSSSQIPKTIPNCEECGAFRVFELQLMPTLIYFLKTPHNEPKALDFGVLAVYTCSKSCQLSQVYYKEFCFIQSSV